MRAADLVVPPGVLILTPPESASPRIHGPHIFGVRPGSPFLYSIPATGQRPLEYAAGGLPAGLKLDAATGRITGTFEAKVPAHGGVLLRPSAAKS